MQHSEKAYHGNYSATTAHAKQLAIPTGVTVRTDTQGRTVKKTSTNANLRLVKTVVLAGTMLVLTLVNALKVFKVKIANLTWTTVTRTLVKMAVPVTI